MSGARPTAIRLRGRRATLPLAIARTMLAVFEQAARDDDERVEEAVRRLLDRFPEAEVDEMLWRAIKPAFAGLLRQHARRARAERFYNAVAGAVLHRRHHHDEFMFPARVA